MHQQRQQQVPTISRFEARQGRRLLKQWGNSWSAVMLHYSLAIRSHNSTLPREPIAWDLWSLSIFAFSSYFRRRQVEFLRLTCVLSSFTATVFAAPNGRLQWNELFTAHSLRLAFLASVEASHANTDMACAEFVVRTSRCMSNVIFRTYLDMSQPRYSRRQMMAFVRLFDCYFRCGAQCLRFSHSERHAQGRSYLTDSLYSFRMCLINVYPQLDLSRAAIEVQLRTTCKELLGFVKPANDTTDQIVLLARQFASKGPAIAGLSAEGSQHSKVSSLSLSPFPFQDAELRNAHLVTSALALSQFSRQLQESTSFCEAHNPRRGIATHDIIRNFDLIAKIMTYGCPRLIDAVAHSEAISWLIECIAAVAVRLLTDGRIPAARRGVRTRDSSAQDKLTISIETLRAEKRSDDCCWLRSGHVGNIRRTMIASKQLQLDWYRPLHRLLLVC